MVQMVSTGAYLPGDPIDNAQLERLAGPLPHDVLEGIQVKTRHWSIDPETGEHNESNSDMACKAVREALELAEMEAGELDLIVVCTASPEYHLPATATFVQEKLGLRRCAAIDIRSGCAGAVEALDLARFYVERGDFANAAVVGSEAISPLSAPIYLGRDPGKIRMRDRLAIYNFGDGAGAMILRAAEGSEDGIKGSAVACVGGEKKPGMQVIGGATHSPIATQLKAKRLIDLRVDVVESAKFIPHVLTEGMKDTLERCGVAAEDVALCMIPEGNAPYMTDELRAAGLLTPEWLALAPKIYENLALVGATGSAAVPLSLDHAWKNGAIARGDIVMLLAIETSKWKYGGLVLDWTAAPVPPGRALAQLDAASAA